MLLPSEVEVTPYSLRRSEAFPGIKIPFGAKVFYLPAEQRSKLDPRVRWGVFVGYRLKPGRRWSGEYLGIDLGRLVGVGLGVSADVNWGRLFRLLPRLFSCRLSLFP